MNPLVKTLSIAAATCFGLISSVFGQLKTYQTLLPYPHGYFNDSSGLAQVGPSFHGTTSAVQGEVFTNVLAIEKMTYSLFTTSGANPVVANLRATFGEWNTASNSFTGPTIEFSTPSPTADATHLSDLHVPAISSWDSVNIGGDDYSTWSITFDITAANGGSLYSTSATKTYALLITQVTGLGNFTAGNLKFGIGQTASESDFQFGYGIVGSSTGSFAATGYDFTFSQIVITPGPIPEASTVAALFALALVAGLVVFRVRQQRKAPLAPASATAA